MTFCFWRCLLISRLLCRAFLVMAVLGSSLAIAQTAVSRDDAARSRITQAVNEGELITLRGNTHPLARPEFDRGPAPADLPLERMVLVLKRSPAQESALQTLLNQQQDRSSPNYHKWLTPEEFGRRFGPSTQDIQVIVSWLESEGFQVFRIANGRTFIEFSGTASQLQNAFHTSIHKFVVNNEEHWANASDPQIPAALAPVVAGIASLHNFRKKPQIVISNRRFTGSVESGSIVPQFNASDGSHGLAPGDYALIYNVNPLYQSGVNGSGISIAIVSRTNIKITDITQFRNLFGLPSIAPQIIVNGKDPGDIGGGDETEAVLDTSWSGALAPNATVKLVVSADTNTSDGVDLSEAYIIDNNLAEVMSESYGDCEANYTAAEASSISALAQQAATEGITYMVSAGDSGSAGCDDPTETSAKGPFSVNILASTPYTVAVGGTMFNEQGNPAAYWSSQNSSVFESALSYIPEDVWNESCTVAQCGSSNAGLWATGGGVSTLFTKPSWQTGVAGIPNDGARDVPDVSLTAAGHDYYLLCVDNSCQVTNGQFSFQGVSGTSAAAPSFAGIVALLDQKAGARQGQIDPILYQLAATENFAACNSSGPGLPPSTCIFHDVTVGNNAVIGEVGYGTASAKYQATAGYDLATGLGSINVANLVNSWSGVATPSGEAALNTASLSFGSQAVTGASAAQTVSLSNPGTTPLFIRSIAIGGTSPSDFTQSNNCGPSLAAGASCTISLTFIPMTTGSRTASLSFTDSAANSPQSVSLSGTGTGSTQALFGGEKSGDVEIVGDFDGDGKLDYGIWRSANGTWYLYESSQPGTLLVEQWGLSGDIPVPADYDGDGKTDFAIFRPSNGNWYILPSRSRSAYSIQWGLPGDIPVRGDFDGDGKSDIAVWRPANATWYFVLSSNPVPYAYQWGLPGDVPVPGDYDASGKQEMAVWRPSNGTWYILPANNPGSPIALQWGMRGDVPIPADYDGDSVTDPAVWRPANGSWYAVLSSTGTGTAAQGPLPTALLSTKYSVGGLPLGAVERVVGDFDGDGKLDFAVWQPSTGTWYVIPSSNPGAPITQQWGLPGDVPVPGDYDGDGRTDFAVFRPSNAYWYIIPSSTGASYASHWGLTGDIPVPGDYDGDGKTDLAIWRPSNGYWFVVPSSTGAAYAVQWGLYGDVPVQGDYDGDKRTDLAVWRPTNGYWYVVPSSNPGALVIQQWGVLGDAPVPGDFDADGKNDFAIWREASQSWFIIPSSNPSVPIGLEWAFTGTTQLYTQPQ